MRDREPMDDFEQRLRAGARSYTQPAVRPFDPVATARAAMSATAPRWMWFRDPRARFGSALAPAVGYGTLLLVVAGIVLALAAIALAPGSTPLPTGPPRLVFVRDGDLFTSAVDGAGATLIRSGGADGEALGYLTATWSPDMRHIAAVRDSGGPVLNPAIEILASDGTLVQAFKPEPGGTPTLSWSPDSRELAAATYPAELPRDAPEAVTAPVHLDVLGINGSARSVPLPVGATWFAGGFPEVFTAPDLGARWSPDGRWIALALDDPSAGTPGTWHLVAADGSTWHAMSDVTQGRCRETADFIDWFADGLRLATVGKQAGSQELCVESLGSRDATGATPEPGTIDAIVDDPTSNLHGLMELPNVSPDGERIAIARFTDDFDAGRHVTVLRVFDVASGGFTDVATGTQTFLLDGTGAGRVTGTLDGTPVWGAGMAWSPDGAEILFLGPERGEQRARWTLRSVAATGSSLPTVVLEGIRSFDLGHPH